MSVRRVNCPGCNAALNIPATMANARCSQCGTVWDVNNPPASKPAPDENPASETPAAKTQSNAAKKRQTAMIALAGSLFTLFAIAAIGIVMLTGGKDPEPPPKVAEIAEQPKATGPFRVVDLPESTRRNIYRDYRLTAGSSVEKKVMVPKDSIAAKTLGKTMGALLDREITHMALLNNISEEDVLQIVAEGDAKGWPPQKKQPKTDDKK